MTESEILERADRWQQAIEARDVDAISDFLHDDYALVLVHPAQATVTRADWLRLLPDYAVHRYTVLARTAAVDGDVAMVLHSAEQHATVAGADRSGAFVVSDCWRRGSDDAWRVWRRHSTPLTAGALPRAVED